MFAEFYHKASNWLAGGMLAVMAVLMVGSVLGDSATTDEQAHIPAGFSYLSERDYRLNPEHPPLIKDLSAVIPYFFLRPNFPTGASAWTEDLNGQWEMGRLYLYESGNRAGAILFASRLPMMLLALFFGWLFFVWVRSRYGVKVALLALFFFSFSPTFIAHARYVTTDVAAAFAFFVGIATFTAFLERPSWMRTIIAGLAFGAALLLKFSTILLPPLYAMYVVLWLVLSHADHARLRGFLMPIGGAFRSFVLLLPKLAAIGALALVLVWGVYAFHVQNYPPERQLADSAYLLRTFGFRPAASATLWMVEHPLSRPLAEYALGVLMVVQRAAGGNTTFFLGDVTNQGWRWYFPVAFLLKEPLPFLLLAASSLLITGWFVARSRWSLRAVFEWMRDNFVLTAGILFIGVYWLQSVTSLLNIGVRHVLPTFPFIYLLVAREIIRGISWNAYPDPQTMREWFITIYRRYIKAAPRVLVLMALLTWMALSTIAAFPYYLSYYNALAGGTANGHNFIVDSNFDWGQDLKRLKKFVEKNNIQKIGVDYFGGGSPAYYLGEKFVPWYSAKGAPNVAGGDPEWIAVSATLLKGAQARPVKGFIVRPEDSYAWLKDKEPVARAGTAIFIYHLK
ncbi:MAG: glycosyltransferase family 39 protein [Candidatus Niyogibacteria bacterium]|nr:glycosyltransferase family 39 protein [Candidatus Niyogibacteria bacterium]